MTAAETPPAAPHPLALACAVEHPADPAVLCRRLDGHAPPHTADGSDPWRTEPEPTEETR